MEREKRSYCSCEGPGSLDPIQKKQLEKEPHQSSTRRESEQQFFHLFLFHIPSRPIPSQATPLFPPAETDIYPNHMSHPLFPSSHSSPPHLLSTTSHPPPPPPPWRPYHIPIIKLQSSYRPRTHSSKNVISTVGWGAPFQTKHRGLRGTASMLSTGDLEKTGLVGR